MLRGYHLSPIQFFSLSILELLDSIDKTERESREMRLMLVGAGMAELEVMFPEFADVKSTADDPDLDFVVATDQDGEPIAAKYIFTEESPDKEAIEAQIAEMLALAATSQATFETPTYGEWV